LIKSKALIIGAQKLLLEFQCILLWFH